MQTKFVFKVKTDLDVVFIMQISILLQIFLNSKIDKWLKKSKNTVFTLKINFLGIRAVFYITLFNGNICTQFEKDRSVGHA